MANSFELASKFQPILDELYKRESLTARLDGKTIDFGGVNEVKIYKTSVVGMGNYDRTNGYPKGDVTGEWETLKLTQSRGREFSIDRMDNDETLGMAFGTLAAEFMRLQVAPEVDAFRFAKYAGWTGVLGGTGALNPTNVLSAFDAASLELDEKEVPAEGRVLFVSSAVNKALQGAVTRMLGNEGTVDRRVQTLDNVTIVPVPQTRFYTKIALETGADSSKGGYKKDAAGADINFILLHPSAVVQATKHAALKIFSPEENQEMDAYKFQYRLYHDAFVYENKVMGIYVHKKA